MIDRLKQIFDTKYSDCKNTLQKISYDKNNKESLCNNDSILFFDYDAIAEDNYSGDTAASPDVIYFKENKIIFIEFKNGKIKSKDKRKIKIKGIEGGFLILHKILSKEIGECNFSDIININKEYYIVYNRQKNRKYPISDAQNSRIGGITKHLESREIQFGLDKYNKTFFRKVITLSGDVYYKEISKICS